MTFKSLAVHGKGNYQGKKDKPKPKGQGFPTLAATAQGFTTSGVDHGPWRVLGDDLDNWEARPSGQDIVPSSRGTSRAVCLTTARQSDREGALVF